ncbi:putative methyltransferase [Pelodytes ibericus]
MAVNLFKVKAFSSVYQKHMLPASQEVMNLIFSYMEKKCQSNEMAVDVGCGTGRYTLPLAHHFQKVLAADISESQLDEAKHYVPIKNVTYRVCPAEKLPVKDASVDLVNSGLAAHWFNVDKFVHEAVRVLKPNGCLAVHAFYPFYEIQYGDYSETLMSVMKEITETIYKYGNKNIEIKLLSQYRDVYNAVPLADKEWVTDIPVVFPMSMGNILGFIQSIYMYQNFLKHDEKKAKEFLMYIEKRFRDILREESDSAVIQLHVKHYCVLACKS